MKDENKMHMPEGYTLAPTSHHGPILGALIIILLLLLGGLYLWGSMTASPDAQQPVPTVDNTVPAGTDNVALGTLSTSDEIDAIESDLNGTDVDTLSSEMIAVEAETSAVFAE